MSDDFVVIEDRDDHYEVMCSCGHHFVVDPERAPNLYWSSAAERWMVPCPSCGKK